MLWDLLSVREKMGDCVFYNSTTRTLHRGHIQSYVFAKFVPVLAILFMLGLKLLELFSFLHFLSLSYHLFFIR